MDPLSVALAVVSLTTAVKDLVELGERINESFAKVSKNLRNAQHVAVDIKEMLEEIKVFCEDHQHALNDMEDFRLALQGLIDKFRNFETSILPLLPQAGGRRRDRLLRRWDSWRNNNKIEGSIVDLQSDIVKVIRRHMMKSTMRTEVKLETIHQETSRGLEILEVVRRDVSALRITTEATITTHGLYESSGSTSDEFNRSIIMFAQSAPSTSAPILRTPNVITEELMTAAYIKLQVNRIVMTIEKMSTLPASGSISFANFQLYQATLKPASMSITTLRNYVVRQVIGVRDLLDSDSESERINIISIYTGGTTLNSLSIQLKLLLMGHEAILVSKWAITLARTLVNLFGSRYPTLGADLALYLLNQSVNYESSGDKIQSLQAVEEAHTITANWPNLSNKEVYIRKLHGDVLLQYARLVDNKRSIEMSIEAIQILDDILNVQSFTLSQSHGNVEQIAKPSSSFFDRLFASAQPTVAIATYAFALQHLGTCLFSDGHHEIALGLALLAIAVRRKMVSIYGYEHRAHLATALSLLVQGETLSLIPAEELVDLADECIQLLRQLVDKNPLYYARNLVDVLWTKAKKLETLNRNIEAIAAWEEVTSLVGQIVQDSELHAKALGLLSRQFRRLKRHDDAARTVMLAITTHHEGAEVQALKYICLTGDLQRLRRYTESVDAARTSAELYRHLAMRDPGKWLSYLTEALSTLALCLASVGDYSEALISWKESVSMLDSSLKISQDETSAGIGMRLYALRIHILISYVLNDEEECLKVNSTAVQHLRRLSEIYPQNVAVIKFLWWTEFCYSYNMLRVERLQDAQQYIDCWLNMWSSRPEAILESEFAAFHPMFHATMVILKAAVLDIQGCTEQALLTTQKVHDIVRPYITTYQSAFSLMTDSMIQKAQLQMDLGNSEEALQIAEGALRLHQDNEPEKSVGNQVNSLYAVASIALSCRDYKRAVEVAREGHNICASLEWRNNEGEYDIFIRPSLIAFLSSAEANLGRCSTALEYARRAVDESLDIRGRKSDISATAAERSYMGTRSYLADVLLATGDLVQARQIYEEIRAYLSKRVDKRRSDYRELAPVLRVLGILCCTEGSHEEGDAAAQELSKIMSMLGSVFPSLQEQVKIRLRNQAEIPILKVLEEMSQKLDCRHQMEVASLFAI